jgi:hypothetical protein
LWVSAVGIFIKPVWPIELYEVELRLFAKGNANNKKINILYNFIQKSL